MQLQPDSESPEQASPDRFSVSDSTAAQSNNLYVPMLAHRRQSEKCLMKLSPGKWARPRGLTNRDESILGPIAKSVSPRREALTGRGVFLLHDGWLMRISKLLFGHGSHLLRATAG